MPATTGFTANDIAQAMKAKAQDAFGETVTAPFSVTDIQQHRAELSYTVTVDYAFEYQSRHVRQATGPLYDQAHMRAVLTQRQGQLLEAPGYLREHTQAQLNNNLSRYREPGKFRVLSDRQVYCGVEDCQGCAGQGTTTCATCNGSARCRCSACHGQYRLRCERCSGTGNTTHSTFCLTCGGSGNCAGNRCHACGGSGKPGYRCASCSGSGTIICHGCHGIGNKPCSACRAGRVTCNTCAGARELIYEYHLEVFADTAVQFNWGQMSAPWMLPAMREILNTAEHHTVFAVDRYHTEHDAANVFTASGHVLAAEARVGYLQASGNCRFIGPKLQPVFLDGVLSGSFKKAVEGVQDHENIWQVSQASSSKIARQLIGEMDTHGDVQHTAPVRNGIISAEDAAAFIQARKRAFQHIIATRHQFRWSAVLVFSFTLTAMLSVFYGLMSILHRHAPSAMAGNEGFIGPFALVHNPGSVAAAFMQPLGELASNLAKGDYWQLACWALAALLFNRLFLPKLAPRVWAWAQGSLLRGILLSLPGILLLALFMALHPSGYVLLRFSELVPNTQLSGALGRVSQWCITYVPQIFALSLAVSLIRYKAAGVHWGQRMLRILLQKRDVSGYQSLIK